MDYKIKSVSSDTVDTHTFTSLEAFIQRQSNRQDPALKNMGWEPNVGFLYNIHHRLRWCRDQGAIYILLIGDQIAGVSCIEYAENDHTWAIGGVRTWVDNEFKGQRVPSNLLVHQSEWAYNNHCDFILVTVNDYNKIIYDAVHKKLTRKSGWGDWWSDCVAVPEQIMIRYTLQWCIMKPLVSKNIDANLTKLKRWASP